MNNKLIIVFISAILCVSVFAQQSEQEEERLYKEICTRGVQGYKKFDQKYHGNHQKGDFWKYFDEIIRNFETRGEFGKILACSEFWSLFKDDVLFNENILSKDKQAMDEIFNKTQKNYKTNLEQRMASLKPIKDPKPIIIKYTSDLHFASKVETFGSLYDRFKNKMSSGVAKIIESGVNGSAGIKSLLQQMDANYPLDSIIKSPLYNYLDRLVEYCRIKSGNTYEFMEEASRERKNKLQQIKEIASTINAFDISRKTSEIETLRLGAEQAEQRWGVHKEFYAKVSVIKSEENDLTLDDLGPLVDEALRVAGNTDLVKELNTWRTILKNIPQRKKGRFSDESIEQYFIANQNIDNPVVRIFKRELKNRLLAQLNKIMEADNKLKNDLEKANSIALKCKNLLKFDTRWNNCIALLKNYYSADEKEDYPALMDFYDGSVKSATECSQLLRQWGVKKREEILKKYEKYFGEIARKALGDSGNKTRDDFVKFKAFYQSSERYFRLEGGWKSRYDWLNEYYFAGTVRRVDNAAKVLHNYFPKLADNYDIPKPHVVAGVSGEEPPKEDDIKEEKSQTGEEPATSDSQGAGQLPQAGPDREDIKRLKKMWEEVTKKKTEEDIVNYILKEGPLKIQGKKSAQGTLDYLFHWFKKLEGSGSDKIRIKCIAMIGEMQTFADNPHKQNEVYEYLLKQKGFDGSSFSAREENPRLDNLKEIIDNNKRYLELYEVWKDNQNISEGSLQPIEKDLNFDRLTLEQQIQAYYILGELNEKIPSGVAPECYYFGKAYLTMKNERVPKIILRWTQQGKVFLNRDDLKKDKVCTYCTPIKNKEDAKKYFVDKYRGVDISDLTSGCSGPSHTPASETVNVVNQPNLEEGPITELNQENLVKFLDMMSEFVMKSRLDDPNLQDICLKLINSDLKGPEFIEVNRQYKDNIPSGYDQLMNRFFHITFNRKEDWKNQAGKIIEIGDWGPEITKKMKEIFEEIKAVFE